MVFLAGVFAQNSSAQKQPESDYLVYVLSESADRIALIRFGPKGTKVERDFETGSMPSDIDGPHGIAISPDKKFYYVTLANGRPYGSVWKYSAVDDRVLGRTQLGFFPATMDLSKDGEFLYAVNFNLHGDMVPSSVSVVATAPMMEIARIPTCTMPHGSRLNPQGTKHYSACMMDDMLVEIDTATLKVSRHFVMTKGKEMGMTGPIQTAQKQERMESGKMEMPPKDAAKHEGSGNISGHGMEPPKAGDTSCSPTWAQPSADGASIFVACNASSEIVEIDAAAWKLKRRLPACAGVYNLAVSGGSKNGKLIATNKRDQSVSIYDIATWKELARLKTKRKVLHGVVVSPDDKYAFISVEGIGSEPGTVEIIDLEALKTVATVDVGQEAAGIDFLRMEKAK